MNFLYKFKFEVLVFKLFGDFLIFLLGIEIIYYNFVDMYYVGSYCGYYLWKMEIFFMVFLVGVMEVFFLFYKLNVMSCWYFNWYFCLLLKSSIRIEIVFLLNVFSLM